MSGLNQRVGSPLGFEADRPQSPFAEIAITVLHGTPNVKEEIHGTQIQPAQLLHSAMRLIIFAKGADIHLLVARWFGGVAQYRYRRCR
jgi:hypothetical protein